MNIIEIKALQYEKLGFAYLCVDRVSWHGEAGHRRKEKKKDILLESGSLEKVNIMRKRQAW